MIKISENRINTLFNEFNRQKIIVIGDLMLDHYIWGRVNKISPEAPVPVVEVKEESYCFGGAANVVFNLKKLGAEVVPIGIIGDDRGGSILQELFKEEDFSVSNLIVDKIRPTTIKTRIIAHDQHVVRIDKEVNFRINKTIQKRIINCLKTQLNSANGIILEDYNKGMLVPELISEIIKLAEQKNIKIFVDPKFDNFYSYKNVTLFKPNRKEVAERLGMKMNTSSKVIDAGIELQKKLNCKALLITLGKQGMVLFEKGEKPVTVSSKAVRIHDVSGAGDTVIASIAISMAAGANMKEAATIANYAAGIVCGEVGIIPIEHNKLLYAVLNNI